MMNEVMFITLTNLQEGACIPLDPVLDNRDGEWEIGLAEVAYYPGWVNIADAYLNNMVQYGEPASISWIPDGLYDVCTLDERVFTPLGLRLTQNPATGKVSIHGIKAFLNLARLGGTLGFEVWTPEAIAGVATAEKAHHLNKYKELFVHLDEGLSTSENRHNQFPSTLLRAIPVKKEGMCSGRTETFPVLQYKRLENGTLSHIRISVRDEFHQPVKLAYLSCVLEIRRRSSNHR